jgi:hypothetical protein
VDAIAQSLQMSADALYEQAGVKAQAEGDTTVVDAIRADPALSSRQRSALIQVYEAFAGQKRRR